MTCLYVSIKNEKIAPFKYGHTLPYGAFINTTKAGKYKIIQEVCIIDKTLKYTWPSSEHAFHAQKIIHLMNKNPDNKDMQDILLEFLNKLEKYKIGTDQEFSPRNDWDPLVTDLTSKHPHLFGNDKKAFDALCDSNFHSLGNPNAGLMPNGEPYTLSFMRTVVRLKLEQYPSLKQLAIDCAREGILPIEVSQYDVNWASGLNGEGANMLGIVILELGNQFLIDKEPSTKLLIPNPKDHYQKLQQKNKRELSHAALVNYATNMTAWTQSTISKKQDTQYLHTEDNTPPENQQNHSQSGAFEGEHRKRYIAKVHEGIDKVLSSYLKNIEKIDKHYFKEAHPKAVSLYNQLNNARQQYLISINTEDTEISSANTAFINQCKAYINEARPVLERDLSWGDYLTNLIKTIANTLIMVFSFGQARNFFKPKTTKPLNEAEAFESELQSILNKENGSV